MSLCVFRSPRLVPWLRVARVGLIAVAWVLLAWAGASSFGLTGRVAWFAEIPANFPALVALGAAAGLLGILLLGNAASRIGAGMLTGLVLAGGIATSPPVTASQRADGSELKLMTWNAYVGSLDPQAAAAEILEMQPDFVAFTEFTPSFRDTVGPLLRAQYPYHLEGARKGHGGLGVYARLPISDWKQSDDRRPRAQFQLEIPGRATCRVLLLHPDVPVRGGYVGRAHSLEAATSELSAGDGPTLVLGDFNATWASADFRKFCETNGLMLASRQQPTWNAAYPPFLRIPIDHILASRRHFSSVSAQSGSAAHGGDHFPVMATVRLE